MLKSTFLTFGTFSLLDWFYIRLRVNWFKLFFFVYSFFFLKKKRKTRDPGHETHNQTKSGKVSSLLNSFFLQKDICKREEGLRVCQLARVRLHPPALAAV